MKLIKTVDGVRVYRDSTWNEFVVKPHGSSEPAWYYTNDRDDALETARVMAHQAARHERSEKSNDDFLPHWSA